VLLLPERDIFMNTINEDQVSDAFKLKVFELLDQGITEKAIVVVLISTPGKQEGNMRSVAVSNCLDLRLVGELVQCASEQLSAGRKMNDNPIGRAN
jgi:hypothetical protein